MTQDADDTSWLIVSQVADRETTRSFKRTVNAAILLRAARSRGSAPAPPGKASRVMTFLGLAELLVGQHEGLLRILIHYLRF
jgi:hypothetical protein